MKEVKTLQCQKPCGAVTSKGLIRNVINMVC
jgi:hypothetical protein